jgi:hypothetical protein
MQTIHRIKAYVGLTMAYGAVRCSLNMYDRQQTYFNFNSMREEIKPMLLSEKAGTTLSQSICAPLVWPFMIAEDAVYLELRLRGEDPAAYGRR